MLSSQRWIIHWGTAGQNKCHVVLQTSANIMYAFYANDLTTTNSPLAAGVWIHIVATWDGTTRKIYTNGSLNISDTPTTPDVTGTTIKIGADWADATPNALIDEVRIYNHALTAAEVAHRYYLGSKTRLR